MLFNGSSFYPSVELDATKFSTTDGSPHVENELVAIALETRKILRVFHQLDFIIKWEV